ncbi:histone [Burkholderia gladioli]|uniref:Histone n=1 Tax=Burkholderia gladioli TaxID=28095 RepID=A0A2A7SA74_BURGA|nr:H-NS histone family protein [Burkholderia gladioli]PEH40471.1 histone [Burkholderia gladioli]
MTTKTYQELLEERNAIDAEIGAVFSAERAAALEKIKALMIEFKIKEADLSARRGPKKGSIGVVPPKYRDPNSGLTWSGRGKPPRWIAGKDRDEFRIVA